MSATICGNERVSPGTAESQTEAQRDDCSGRDARGRFTDGNIGGPGNPFARRVARYRKALHHCASMEDMKEIGRQLVAKAKTGDVAAIKLLLQYQVGKPAPVVDPDTLDLQEIALFLRGPTADQIHALTSGQHLPPDAWMAVLRVCLPLIARQFHDVFLNMFARTDAAQAAGVTPDTDEIVEDAIDEVLGRSAEEMLPSEGEEPESVAPAANDGEVGDDPRPTATPPLTNGQIHGMDRRQFESANGDDQGRREVITPLRPCPLCGG
jgi:hypothetical protein